MNVAALIENLSMPPAGNMFSGKGNYVGIGRIGMVKPKTTFDPSEGRDYELDAKPKTKADLKDEPKTKSDLDPNQFVNLFDVKFKEK